MQDGTNISEGLSYNVESRDTSSADDADLVTSAQQGNLAAFETLVMRHQRKMLNIAFRLINDYDEACEAVQDAFVSAFMHLKKFRREAKFATWMTTITINFSKNRLKHMKNLRGRIAFSLDEPVRGGKGQLEFDPPSSAPSALVTLEQREMQQKVQSCIKTLDAVYREVLILRDLQDFSYDEIRSILNVREGTVKSRLSRARELVKECLKHSMGEL